MKKSSEQLKRAANRVADYVDTHGQCEHQRRPGHYWVADSEPPARPRASVVVAVRGNAAALPGLVAALSGQDVAVGDVELVVVNNHHRPQVPARVVENTPLPVRVVHESRPGLSRARNIGIRAARGEYVLITDPDARPVTSWVRHMVATLEHTGAYCAGGKVVPRWTGTQPPRLDPRVARLFVPLTRLLDQHDPPANNPPPTSVQ